MPKTSTRNNALIFALAKEVAAEKIRRYREEIAMLVATFPDLREGQVEPAQTRKTKATKNGRKSKMSAAQRKAVSERMRAYWAKRSGKATKAKRKTGKAQASTASDIARITPSEPVLDLDNIPPAPQHADEGPVEAVPPFSRKTGSRKK